VTTHLLDHGEPTRGVEYLTKSGARVIFTMANPRGELHFRYVGGKEVDSFWLSAENFYRYVRVAPIAVQVPE
jgi:hypothetical protein